MNLPENANSSEQRRILDALPVLVFLERGGTIVYANREAREMLGLAEGEWAPRPVEEVLWGLFPGTAEPQTLLMATGQGSPFHATMPAKSGRLLPVEGTYSLIDAELREAVIVAHPGGRERAPKSRLMEDVLASLPEAVAIEHEGNLLYSNPAFGRMFGYDNDELSGSLRDLVVPETRWNEYATLRKAVDEHGGARVETVRATKSGELVDVSLQMAPLLVNGARVGYVHSYRDISARKETEAKLQFDAMHDVLTGLPNRALFQDRLKLALSRRLRRPENSCGVLYLDLDRFKEINDALGHAAGDVLLKEVALRLGAALRPQDSAARLGGDEFAVLVENIVAVSDLETVAHRILSELQRPFEIFGRMIQTGASIGAAIAGPAHTAPELLMRDADLAMYRAKQAGGARLEVFDRHLAVAVSSQRERERELRTILERRMFELRFQPILQLADGRVEGFETVLCWQRPDGGVESFRELMETAEDTGLSIALGREMLEAACRRLRDWEDALAQNCPYLTVNLTARQFYHADLLPHLSQALAASGVDPSRLVLEIPESALNENPDAAIAILQRLVDANVRVAMDEFGSTLAPLNHLLRLPLDMVKLDGKLTPTAASSGRHRAVVEALIRLGRSLGVHVVADGIVSQTEISSLHQMGCTSGQGTIFYEPLQAEQAMRLAGARSAMETPGL